MNRKTLIEQIVNHILTIKKEGVIKVGIDGIDASGKTIIADELAEELKLRNKNVIRASIDGFHNSRKIRYTQGTLSPQGYFYDSFNYSALKELLLDPLSDIKDLSYKTKLYDFIADKQVAAETIKAEKDSILIFEGVFLFRKEIGSYWDLKIFIKIKFEKSLERALARDLYLFNDINIIKEKYSVRYIPGQMIYYEKENPELKTDIIIDNNDFNSPEMIFKSHMRKL